MEEFVEEIQNRRTTNFKVTKIPVGALKEFKKFCQEECGDMYSVGIIQLLKMRKQLDAILKLNDKEVKTFG